MSSSSTDGFSQFTFHFRRLNLDSLFSIDDRNRMLNWIDRARCLLIEILRSEHTTPKLILFRSYSHDGNVDGGDLVERLLLDGELHLSKPPPTPPILFLIVSADGTQVPLPKEVVEECIKKRSFVPISQLVNSWQYNNGQKLTSSGSRKESTEKLPVLEPLLTFQILTSDSAPAPPSSPTIPTLTSMLHAQ
ncbi:unnamed protein product [Rotaria sordida]|uniref:Uncharacterized protein n=1 Tax=Rotaria sordida TaxID=392033 RepID=A0A819HNR6_9BILA|nr:unnamed protein product [Rotaria sordida]CAF4111740.1 unnamed protein product [Rotaria sordida]